MEVFIVGVSYAIEMVSLMFTMYILSKYNCSIIACPIIALYISLCMVFVDTSWIAS
jgi:hypothetical protein